MISTYLKAAFKCPELLNNLHVELFTNTDIILAFQVLAVHKPQVPGFYTQFTYSFLKNNQKFSPFLNFLSHLQFSSLFDLSKSIFKEYNKLKTFELQEFTKIEVIEMIISTSLLCEDSKYKDTAQWILEELCDSLIRNPEFISVNQSIVILKSLYDKENLLAANMLTHMCKAHIWNNRKGLNESLSFYKKNDEFYKLINNL